MLLTDGGVQAPATARYLSAHPGAHYAVGGPAAQADPAATALVGADRYATATLVAARFFPSISAAAFATGLDFPDALADGTVLGGTAAVSGAVLSLLGAAP